MPDRRALLGPMKRLLEELVRGPGLLAFEAEEAPRIESFPFASLVKSFQKPTSGLRRQEFVSQARESRMGKQVKGKRKSANGSKNVQPVYLLAPTTRTKINDRRRAGK